LIRVGCNQTWLLYGYAKLYEHTYEDLPGKICSSRPAFQGHSVIATDTDQ